MSNQTARLPLKNHELSKNIIIDAGLHQHLSRFRWYIPNERFPSRNPRPYTYIPRPPKRPQGRKPRHPKMVYLARVLTGAKKGQFVQHLNGDTLDCRQENLRVVDTREEAGQPAHPARQHRCPGSYAHMTMGVHTLMTSSSIPPDVDMLNRLAMPEISMIYSEERDGEKDT